MPNERQYHFSGGTSAERRLQARIAANTRWAFESDRSAATAPARRAMDERFEKLVDPEGKLSPRDRAIRAEAARRAHFLKMAAKSAAVRREKAALKRRPPARRGDGTPHAAA